MNGTLALGLDFGTESVRAVLLDCATGAERGNGAAAYEHGVLDRTLPTGEPLPDQFALQDPADWLLSMTAAVRAAMAQAGAAPSDVVGIGVDFTSCTVLPVTADGTPLCQIARFRSEPHAWPKLWKHHAAQRQADAVNALAQDAATSWLERYGGQISSEWLLPKTLEILESAPSVFHAADLIVEAADWIVWQLTGRLARNACAAGFKATWHRRTGYPDRGFLRALNGELHDYFDTKGAGRVVAPGTPIGGLREPWPGTLGIDAHARVAAGIIDAHAGVLGAGAIAPGTLYMAMGTSTCHMLIAEQEVLVPGISGVVEDGIVPGRFGYEAGQAAVGDLFAWQVRHSGQSHGELTAGACALHAGQSGLLAIDWFNGSRTPYVDADLTGAILGLTLATTPAEVYRALIEGTAYGTRAIVDAFLDAGIAVTTLEAGGGLAASPLVLSIYANVLGTPLSVCTSEYPSARGAAVLGAVAGGAHADVAHAAASMAPERRTVSPAGEATRVYDHLYAEYRLLADRFGGRRDSVLRRLAALKHAEPSTHAHPSKEPAT